MNLQAVTKKNIKKHKLIGRGEKILLSLSGGPDSTALLYLLAGLRKELEFDLAAVYLNHNLRPRDIGFEIKFCKRICRELDVPFYIEEENIPDLAERESLSIEEAGRQFRKVRLAELSDRLECQKIAVGHHLDDQIETILFRLFRGTGPGGMNPIRPAGGKYIRPLYNINKSDILEYLESGNLECMFDRTNFESEYSRNYIRNELLPLIEKRFGATFSSALLKFASIISEQDRYLRDHVSAKLKKIVSISPGGKIVVDLKRFDNYALPLKRVMAKILLEQATRRPGYGTYREIDKFLAIAGKGKKGENFGEGLNVFQDREHLYLFVNKTEIPSRDLEIPSRLDLEELSGAIITRLKKKVPSQVTSQKKNRRVFIDADRIEGTLKIRSAQNGDRFRPFGMKGTKKIGDFLTDRKVPASLRDEIPVLEDENGIIWIAGIEIDDRVRVTKETRKVLEIEYTGKTRRYQGV